MSDDSAAGGISHVTGLNSSSCTWRHPVSSRRVSESRVDVRLAPLFHLSGSLGTFLPLSASEASPTQPSLARLIRHRKTRGSLLQRLAA